MTEIKEEYLQFLDWLRISGVTNMYGAAPYLQDAFEELKNPTDARTVLGHWMQTFSERQ